MVQGWIESTREISNYGRFINQFLTNIKKSTRQFEKINKKYVTKISIMITQICIHEEMLPMYTKITK